MGEKFRLRGTKLKVASIAQADLEVARIYPEWQGTREGSACHWHWLLSDRKIAEAWIGRDKSFWWLRIRYRKESRHDTLSDQVSGSSAMIGER